jgi:acyl-CoA synthetase (AMP-forming)/AMP-acid ligase II/ABC-type nitrate/sulfonate/bicarbonate transport system permease component
MIVRDHLEKQAATRPNKVAILFKEEKITFSDLDTMSNRLANRLLNAGIKKGDRVVLLFQNCPEFCVAYFAILKIGAIAVVLDFRLSPAEMEPIFQEAEVSGVITSIRQKVFIDRMRKVIPTLNHVVVTGSEGENIRDWHSYEEIIERDSSDQISIPLQEEDESLYLYTSGTTGKSKGVVLTNNHLTYFPETLHHAMPISEQDTFGLVLPISHISGPIVMNLMAESGLTVSLVDEMKPKKILDAVESHRITVFHAVPPIFQLILNVPHWERYDCSSLRVIAMMGTVVPEQLMKEFGERYPNLQPLQGYGATETSPLLTLTHLKDAPRKMASAGKAAPRAELKIIDQEGKEVQVGQMGEVIARGAQIMKGYFKDPRTTAKKIKDGWYHSGDLGRFDEEGYLYIVGRVDEMVISGGLNVYPSEVETVLLNHPKIQEAAVVGIPDSRRGQVLRANVVLKHGETATHREILKFCKERLASFKMPRQLEFKDSLPKSRTGKVSKRQLRVMETSYEKWRDFLSEREAFIGPLALILIWYLVSAFQWVNPFFLPTPLNVFLKLKEVLLSGGVYVHLGKTLYRMFSGYLLGVLLGVPLGVIVGYWEKAYNSLEFLIEFFRGFPATSLFPLFMLAFGIGDAAKIAIVIFSCSLVITINTLYGVRNSSKTRQMVAETMKAGKTYIFARVILPDALPYITAGLRTALSITLIIVVILEMFIGTDRGLGHLIYNAHMTYQIPEMYVMIIITGLIGYGLNKGFIKLEEEIIHWGGK